MRVHAKDLTRLPTSDDCQKKHCIMHVVRSMQCSPCWASAISFHLAILSSGSAGHGSACRRHLDDYAIHVGGGGARTCNLSSRHGTLSLMHLGICIQSSSHKNSDAVTFRHQNMALLMSLHSPVSQHLIVQAHSSHAVRQVRP